MASVTTEGGEGVYGRFVAIFARVRQDALPGDEVVGRDGIGVITDGVRDGGARFADL